MTDTATTGERARGRSGIERRTRHYRAFETLGLSTVPKVKLSNTELGVQQRS